MNKTEPQPRCGRCDSLGQLPYAVHYAGLGDSPVTYCKECPLGRKLMLEWTRMPEQRAYVRRVRKGKIRRALEQSCIGPAFADARIGSLVDQPEARAECARYLRQWQSMRVGGRGLHFWGAVGTGKTYAAAALANALMEGHLVETLFLGVPELAGRLREAINDESNSDGAALLRRMKEVQLLVLDDLGLERPSDWFVEQLYRVVDQRCRERRPMLVISHGGPSELPRRYTPQLASRIEGCCKAVRMVGKDRRRRRLPG